MFGKIATYVYFTDSQKVSNYPKKRPTYPRPPLFQMESNVRMYITNLRKY